MSPLESPSRLFLLLHGATGVVIAALLLWSFGLFGEGTGRGRDYPLRPIKVVVPYPAGGGSDTFTRIIERAVSEGDLLPVSLVIQNLGGGSGTIGIREVAESRADGYTLLMHHNSLLGVHVDGVSEFGPDDFQVIALTGVLPMLIVVREDSPFETLPDMLGAAREQPGEITLGANQGSHAYFTGKRLEASLPGARFAMVNADGGADRYARIIGGHLDAGIFSLAEYLDLVSPAGTPPDQNVRALVLLSPEPHEAIPEVPTTRSQGIEVFMENAYYWWAPLGTPEPVLERLRDMLREAMRSESVVAELGRLRIRPEFLVGDEMMTRLRSTWSEMREAKLAEGSATGPRKGAGIRHLPVYVGSLVLILLVAVVGQSRMAHRRGRGSAKEEEEKREDAGLPRHPGLAGLCFGILLLYAITLEIGSIPWTAASMLMILFVGGLLCRWERTRMLVVAELAILIPLATAFLFTEILPGVILP